jgi:predicted flap endonuclease-1-like 5' DNA nuclease
MPYTLVKLVWWMLASAVVGGVIGWLLREIRCKAELKALRATVVDSEEVERMRNRLANLEPVVADRDRMRTRVQELEAELAAARRPAAGAATRGLDEEAAATEVAAFAAVAPAEPEPVLDLAAGAVALGLGKLALDDLKVVEGIGPKIAELLHAAGITTWRQLAQAAPAAIKEVLDAAGPNYAMHDPITWPQQAELLATGQWAAFKELTDSLTGGR